MNDGLFPNGYDEYSSLFFVQKRKKSIVNLRSFLERDEGFSQTMAIL